MKKIVQCLRNNFVLLIFAGSFSVGVWAAATAQMGAGTYILKEGSLHYLAEHKLHNTDASSLALKGKAVCTADSCEFLVAVPINTFDSKNANRDAHMLEITKGAQFPMVSLHLGPVKMSEFATPTGLKPEVTFGGQKATLVIESFSMAPASGGIKTSFKGHFSLKDFGVEAPALLGMAVNDTIKIDGESVWGQ